MRESTEIDLGEFVSHLMLLSYIVRFEVLKVVREVMMFCILMACRLVGRYL
jgi:hypothetical protein